MNAPKKSLIVLTAVLFVATCTLIWGITHSIGKNETQENQTNISTGPENLLDFDLLEQTQPDEDYKPLYPAKLDQLDGKTVILRGYMTPYDSLENLQEFMSLGFPTGCNFCAPPSANQVVLVRQPERRDPYPFIDGPIEITGSLKLWREHSEDTAHKVDHFLYVIMAETVTELDPSLFMQNPEEHRQN